MQPATRPAGSTNTGICQQCDLRSGAVTARGPIARMSPFASFHISKSHTLFHTVAEHMRMRRRAGSEIIEATVRMPPP